jgi:alpha-glucosidase
MDGEGHAPGTVEDTALILGPHPRPPRVSPYHPGPHPETSMRPLAFIRPAALIAAFIFGLSHAVLAQTAGDGAAIESAKGGIARFVEKGVKPESFAPSIALARVPKTTDAAPTDIKATPLFWKDKAGKFCVRVDIDAGTSLYGTGEIAGPLLRNGRKTVCWNTDAYGYTEENASLYQSHPWVLAVRADGSAFGVLADTTWRCEIDLTGAEKGEKAGGSIVFRGEGAGYPVYVIDRASPQEVMTGLAELIGTMPMPPRWAIGYHQCRYSYNPDSRVREIAQNFRDRKIPCDVIWFDIDYMDGYRIFTVDKSQFPDPKKLNDDLGKQGFHRIWMIDPGVKAEPGYSVYDQMTSKDLAVKNAKGEVYKGEVWPGWCVYPDYTRYDVRQWWSGLYKNFIDMGVSGVWNDMNEPAVFNVKSKTMPEDNLHKGGPWDTRVWMGKSEEDKSTQILPPGPHLKYHNVYGTLMAKGTFEGILAAAPTKRPFVLTRAGYIGSQRYAATWTGDNSAEWKDLEASVSMVANLGLSGQPFCGPDIGGFNGNGDAKLYARWIGVGALLPFSRGHTGKGNINKEPWAFGPEVEQTARFALERRYRLLPYLYTLFAAAQQTGMPVLRPVFFADPKDPALRSEDDAFLLGSDLLVVPKLTPERDRTPALPKGIWNEVQLVEEGVHPDLPRLYVRGGSIIPVGPILQYSGDTSGREKEKAPPMTLLISLDEGGSAMGKLYEDDGDGFEYLKGNYAEVTYFAHTIDGNVVVETQATDGRWRHEQRDLRLMLLKDGWYTTGVTTDGMRYTFLTKQSTPIQFPQERPEVPKTKAP